MNGYFENESENLQILHFFLIILKTNYAKKLDSIHCISTLSKANKFDSIIPPARSLFTRGLVLIGKTRETLTYGRTTAKPINSQIK
jgi:hypothetical protein